MIWLAAALAAVAIAYQFIALFACFRHLLQRAPKLPPQPCPGVSILKPFHGIHPGFREAVESHLRQSYPEFEILFGYQDPDDSAVPALTRLNATRHHCPGTAPNGKVAVLRDLVQHARFPVIIVSDADIVVPPDYVRDVVAPLADPGIGIVTCLYRAQGESWPARFEALGVDTDFAPSTLVAPLFGVSEFGFGSTLAFRAKDLNSIGGFDAVAGYLADDYQLGARIHRLGRRNLISKVVVSTRLDATTWAQVWRHQLRWARTIRVSRAAGYAGLPVTFATLWALVAAGYGLWWLALAALASRLAVALAAGWFVLRSPDVVKLLVLIPIRDLYGVIVWAAGLFGNSVEWGGHTLHLDRHGRIIPYSAKR